VITVGGTSQQGARLNIIATSAVDVIHGFDNNLNQVFAVENAGSLYNGLMGQEFPVADIVNRTFFGNYSVMSANRLSYTEYILSNLTSNATPTLLKIDGSTTSIPTTTAIRAIVGFSIDVAAANSTGTLGWYHRFTGAIRVAANTGTIVDAITEEILAEDTSAATWTATVSVSNASGYPRLTVTVTGAAATSIYWSANAKLNVLGFGGLP
jgi:hypothetical protein